MREGEVGLPGSVWRYRLQELGAVGFCVVSAACGEASRPAANELPNAPVPGEADHLWSRHETR